MFVSMVGYNFFRESIPLKFQYAYPNLYTFISIIAGVIFFAIFIIGFAHWADLNDKYGENN